MLRDDTCAQTAARLQWPPWSAGSFYGAQTDNKGWQASQKLQMSARFTIKLKQALQVEKLQQLSFEDEVHARRICRRCCYPLF